MIGTDRLLGSTRHLRKRSAKLLRNKKALKLTVVHKTVAEPC
jgi:hypothetical protein